MLLFKRIFKFEKAKVEQLEKRLNQRYVPGPGFPLRATLRYGGRDSSAKILNMSGNGIGVQVRNKPDLPAGMHLRADLQMEQHRIELNARIAHVDARDGGFALGLGFVFEDFESQKSYMQLIQPVVIGQSLQPMAIDRVVQDDPQFFKRIFVGESDSLLTVKLAMSPVDPLHSFEFRMLDYFCRGSMDAGGNQTYALESRDATEEATGQPVFETSGGTHDEIRQLFRWILPNLTEAVPEDFRAFMQRFAG
ncbi:MAG: PilZ domain-containing protein [Opitutae bacterium]|nr:PilZ domain-containing protein [Opitutae bacterium]